MKEDPLAVAEKFLPGFRRADNTVDGRWHSLDAIMRLTNREILRHNRRQREAGEPQRAQVGHNPAWLVKTVFPAAYAEGAAPQPGWGTHRLPEMD